MALLNYSSQYSSIQNYLGATEGTTDWLKIFVSPELSGGGHFITHGIDFGASYLGGSRGLVPANSLILNKSFLRGDGWSALWNAANEAASQVGDTEAQRQAALETYLQTTIVSAYDIKQWIQQSFSANDSMRFKGVISIDGSENISTITDSGTRQGFPTFCEVGDTYKINGQSISGNSYIAGEPVSSGDMIVCIQSGSGENLNSPLYWTIVQDNVEHLISYMLNGVEFRLYAQTPGNIQVYAPTTSGTLGQVLVSQGLNTAPTWVYASTLVVAEAAKTTHSLLKGIGVRFLDENTDEVSYDGSKDITLTLAPATPSTIGGVIIDNGTNSEMFNKPTNTSGTTYPTITVTNNGQIYLTRANIVNALGYDPISALPIFSETNDGLVPMSSQENKQTNNVDNISNPSTFLLGSDAKWYKLPVSSFSSDQRILQLNGTTIIPGNDTTPLNIIAGSHINITALQQSEEYTGAFKFDVLWRDIQVRLMRDNSISQYVTSIGNNDPLVFDNSDSIFTIGEEVAVGQTRKTVLKSYVTWYNLDTGEYEII